MVVEVLEAAELLDELPRPLGADARHPGDAVGAVPLDGLDVDELAGSDAVVLLDLGLVVQSDTLRLGRNLVVASRTVVAGLTSWRLSRSPVAMTHWAPLPLALGGEGCLKCRRPPSPRRRRSDTPDR